MSTMLGRFDTIFRPALISAWGAALLSCAAPDAALDGDLELGVASESIQLGNYSGNTVIIQGALGQVPQALATAALRFTNVGTGMPFATCGATFVSKEYAVTAAHCVKHLTPVTSKFSVEEIEISSLDMNWFRSYMTISGTWSNGSWDNGADLGPNAGYTVVTHNGCYVARRCGASSLGGQFQCPSQVTPPVDIALVRCPTRTFRNYAFTSSALAVHSLPTNVDDIFDFGVDMWWFHELYNLPTWDNGTERWRNYGAYGGEAQAGENWHYQRYHQLVPLLSTTFANGNPYGTVKPKSNEFEGATLNSTDMAVCHGASGSGVFMATQNVLLGPMIGVGAAADVPGRTQGRLCDDFQAAQPRQRNSVYIRAALTDAFVLGSPEVLSNR